MNNQDIIIEASFGENFFAPKCFDRDEHFDTRNSHAIANTLCNFKCAFCKNGLSEKVKPDYCTLKEFSDKIDLLMKKGKMFKFTGGEPTMNPNLEKLMKIIKEKGGIIFLDTNGSMESKVSKLLDEGLVDVLGISLKGLSPEEAMKTSGIPNQNLCWDNPILSIKNAIRNDIRVIVTYVAYDNFNYKDLCNFAKVLDNIGDNIYLKLNNLCGDKHRDKTIKAIEEEKLVNMMEKFIKENEKWKGKCILINSSAAVTNYSKILFY